MSVFTRRECDGCHTHVKLDDPILGSWYRLSRHNPREWAAVGDDDPFDFCSLPCLAAWAMRNRELGVRVIREPVGVAS